MNRHSFILVCLLLVAVGSWIHSGVQYLLPKEDRNSLTFVHSTPGATVATASTWSMPAVQPITTYRRTHRHYYAAPAVSESLPTLAMQSTSGQGMRLYTTSSAAVSVAGACGSSYGGAIAQNTSSSSRGIHYSSGSVSLPNVQVITTSASAVNGGVTASETLARIAAPRRNSPGTPGVPDCGQCVDANGDGVCDRCGCDLLDGCTCAAENGYCWCPLETDISAVLFLALLSAIYIYKKHRHAVLLF